MKMMPIVQPPNQALHGDRGRILVSLDKKFLQTAPAAYPYR